MAQYPNTSNIDWIDSTVAGQGDELVDQQDVNFAEHVNELRGEVKAIALELGSNPRGAQSTVRARLENIETTKSSTSHNHDTAYVARSVLAAKGNHVDGSVHAGVVRARSQWHRPDVRLRPVDGDEEPGPRPWRPSRRAR